MQSTRVSLKSTRLRLSKHWNLTQSKRMNPGLPKHLIQNPRLKLKRNPRLKQLRNPKKNKFKSQLPPILFPRFPESSEIWTLSTI